MNERSHRLALNVDAIDTAATTSISRDSEPTAPECCSGLEVDAAAVARVLSRLADAPRVEKTTAIFSAMADPTRFRIINALALEELCVCDLAAVSGVSQSGVSHQLRLLRDRGLVAYRREGNRAVYRLADDHVRALLAQGLAHADEPQVER